MTARTELNPKMHTDGQYIYIVGDDGKRRYLCNSLEGFRFALECRCGNSHVRFATLHAIKAAYDLFCQWCECEQDSWLGSNKDAVSEAEKEAMAALHSVGLDRTTACQVVLPFWDGRLDFYHIPSRTAMQADGSSHFEHMYHRAPHFQLLSDIECCKRAWEQGVRLLRVHHLYAHSARAMVAATQMPYAKCVMLAGDYDRVLLWNGTKHVSYTSWLEGVLPHARCQKLGIPNCFIFHPLTL